MVDKKFEDLSALIKRRAQRFKPETCADGQIRVCYTPISANKRNCMDCVNFDVGQARADNPELFGWCIRSRKDDLADEMLDDFSKAETCPHFILLGITKDYRARVKTGNGLIVKIPIEKFCRKWNPKK